MCRGSRTFHHNSEHLHSKTIYLSLTLDKKTSFFEHFHSKTIYLGPENRVKVGREGFFGRALSLSLSLSTVLYLYLYLYCTLYCTVLYCTLYCTVPCTVPYCTLYCTVPYSLSSPVYVCVFLYVSLLKYSNFGIFHGVGPAYPRSGPRLALTRSQGVYFFKCAGGREHFITILNIFTAKQFT